MLTSYEFEVAAKNAVIEKIKEHYNEDYVIQDMHLVSYGRALKNQKCTMIELGANKRYYEVTFNGNTEEMYVDIYQKEFNHAIPLSELKLTVD